MKTKKLICLTLLVALMCGLLASCGKREEEAGGRLNVACSIFPVYDFTRLIAGERADVWQMLPPGADSHEYEPTVGDMVACDKADLFIYTDSEMEVWIDNLAQGFTHVKIVRCAQGIDLEALNEEWEQIENDHDEEEHGHSHKYDAHIWLDPRLAVVMCENILLALIEADRDNAQYYTANCKKLTDEIEQLDDEFESLFKNYPDALLCFGGEFAYSHFIRRYNLRYLSAFDGCSEEEEVNLKSLISIIEEMKRQNAACIFTDEVSSGETAREIARETGARVLLFHSCHSVSRGEESLHYTDIMRGNMERIILAISDNTQGE